jgi:hypothetical protein
LASIRADAFLVADGIDSKDLFFCQCGSRALQQEGPAETEKPGFSQPKDGLIADGDLLGAIHRNRFNPLWGRVFPHAGLA